jgi:VanZ family protein
MSTLQPNTRSLFLPLTPSRRWIGWLVLPALLVGFLGWGYVMMRLTSASRVGVDDFENRVRHRLVREGLMPRQYRHWYPENLDLAKHLLFYAPFGLMAGIASSAIRFFPRGSFPRFLPPHRMAWALVGTGVLLAALDETRQIWIPSRSADMFDLLAGWAGIGFAFLLWRLSEKGLRNVLPYLTRKSATPVPCYHQP